MFSEPSETSKMEFFAKIFECILTIFAKQFLLFVSQILNMIKLNKILVCCYLFHKKLGLQSLQIFF